MGWLASHLCETRWPTVRSVSGDDRSLQVTDLHHRYDDAEVLAGVTLVAPAGQVTALLGPSGSGKTTLLRCIAGLDTPAGGTIQLGAEVLSDAARRLHVAAEHRGLGMVFQDGALFPHLDVAHNVAFGLPRAERRGPRVDEALELVGLGGFARRSVHSLSGGQRQRVALARALAPRPGLLLLDEPFSNLDALLRTELRAEVRDLLRAAATTALWVTHDRSEAFQLAESVAVLRDGRVVQQDAPTDLYRRPVDPWVASFVGEVNLLTGVAAGPIAVTSVGEVTLADPSDGEVTVLVRPEDLTVVRTTSSGRWRVLDVVFEGHDHVLVVAGPAGPLRLRARRPGVAVGDRIGVAVRPDLTTVAWPRPAALF